MKKYKILFNIGFVTMPYLHAASATSTSNDNVTSAVKTILTLFNGQNWKEVQTYS